MRKSPSQLTRRAKTILATQSNIDTKGMGSDPSWALAEAALIETPIGEVHLHWHSHRGMGRWTLVTSPRKVNHICDTARCRRVTIIPHGGENESVPLNQRKLDEIQDDWSASKWGAYCPLPEPIHYIDADGKMDSYLEPRGVIWHRQYWEDRTDWEAISVGTHKGN